MLKFENYNPDEKCNCVIRSLSKILELDTSVVLDEIKELASSMNHSDYSDVEVFEKYMEIHNIFKDDKVYGDVPIKDIDFSDGKYVIFCWDKEDFYHLVTVIDNNMYDKNENTLNLYPITIYKEKVKDLIK